MVASAVPEDRSQHTVALWDVGAGKQASIPCSSRVQSLAFDRQSESDSGAVFDSETCRRVDWSAGGTVVSTLSVGPRCGGGALDPYASENALTCDDTALRTWDLRSGEATGAVPDAHEFAITDVCYSPSVEHQVASAGEDSKVRLWDTRKFDQCLQVFQGHTHWVVRAQLGQQPQLVLSSGTDALVCLWRTSPAVYGGAAGPRGEGLVTCYQEHEDSVYGCCWSAESPWVFASLSYEGCLLVHTVPSDAKEDILLS